MTAKGAAGERHNGRIPRSLLALCVTAVAIVTYAAAGLFSLVPWRTSPGATVASGAWLALGCVVLLVGTARIRAAAFATSRRNAHRIPLRAPITVDGRIGELVDVSVGGAAVRFGRGALPAAGLVELGLPGMDPIKLDMVRTRQLVSGEELATLRIPTGDWDAYRDLSLWVFHTPAGAVPGLPAGVPAAAVIGP